MGVRLGALMSGRRAVWCADEVVGACTNTNSNLTRFYAPPDGAGGFRGPRPNRQPTEDRGPRRTPEDGGEYVSERMLAGKTSHNMT